MGTERINVYDNHTYIKTLAAWFNTRNSLRPLTPAKLMNHEYSDLAADNAGVVM